MVGKLEVAQILSKESEIPIPIEYTEFGFENAPLMAYLSSHSLTPLEEWAFNHNQDLVFIASHIPFLIARIKFLSLLEDGDKEGALQFAQANFPLYQEEHMERISFTMRCLIIPPPPTPSSPLISSTPTSLRRRMREEGKEEKGDRGNGATIMEEEEEEEEDSTNKSKKKKRKRTTTSEKEEQKEEEEDQSEDMKVSSNGGDNHINFIQYVTQEDWDELRDHLVRDTCQMRGMPMSSHLFSLGKVGFETRLSIQKMAKYWVPSTKDEQEEKKKREGGDGEGKNVTEEEEDEEEEKDASLRRSALNANRRWRSGSFSLNPTISTFPITPPSSSSRRSGTLPPIQSTPPDSTSTSSSTPSSLQSSSGRPRRRLRSLSEGDESDHFHLYHTIPAQHSLSAKMRAFQEISELPVDLNLTTEHQHFHSIFSCFVSRDIATYPSNPPVLLTCGHVVCKHAMENLRKQRGRFKCPSCYSEVYVKDAMELFV